jgi:hypothetical protein
LSNIFFGSRMICHVLFNFQEGKGKVLKQIIKIKIEKKGNYT